MTKEQAITLFDSEFWKTMTHYERALFQLWEQRLCMPFSVFHESVEKALGRPVYTHEFAFAEGLRQELLGQREPPSEREIMALIPPDKRIILLKGPG